MKLLIFAHTPPPHHGQSYMVELLVRGLGGDCRQRRSGPAGTPPKVAGVDCYHVNARLSDDVAQIGKATWSKPFRVLRYGIEAIWCRIRHGVRTMYYVPAPDLRVAVWRDFIVMAMCRPFFKTLVYHHHAMGLARWLAEDANRVERWLGRWLLERPTLSLVLGEFNRKEAEQLKARRIVVVPNGIPDPCEDYGVRVRPKRAARLAVRRAILAGRKPSDTDRAAAGEESDVIRLLYLGLCCREKGLFDVVEAAGLLQKSLQQSGCALRVRVDVAGKFWRESEREEFERLIAGGAPVKYHGFVGAAEKARLLTASDIFCFPTYYWAESFGLVLVEAMAHGLACVTTRWRSIPELFESDYAGFVEPRDAAGLGAALRHMLQFDGADRLRRRFEDSYQEEVWLEKVRAALEMADKWNGCP